MKVGDRVICINTNWSVDTSMYPEVTFPKLNQELTIREMYFYPFSGGMIGLIFEEIRNPMKGLNIVFQLFGKDIEHDFDSRRFRKIEKTKFTNALTKKLAQKALEEFPEYCPEELIKEKEVLI